MPSREELILKVTAEVEEAKRKLAALERQANALEKDKVEIPVTAAPTGLGKVQAQVGSLVQTVTSKVPGMNRLLGPGIADAASIGTGAIAGMATAGAAALVGFASKAVSQFQSLALEVGKFSDATGVSADAASRFIEVASDVGLSASTIETIVGRMNKVLGSTPEVFTDAGIAIATLKDGSTDVATTFANAVEKISSIHDPTQRAALAAKIFGKNWQSAAELVTGGVDNLAQRLADVEGAQLIDEGEVAKARETRDSFDELGDTMDRLSNIVGEALAPVLADAAEFVSNLLEDLGKILTLGGKLQNSVQDPLGNGGKRESNLGKAWGIVRDGLRDTGDALRSVFGSMDPDQLKREGGAAKDAGDALKDAAAGADELTGAHEDLGESTDEVDWETWIDNVTEAAKAEEKARKEAKRIAEEIEKVAIGVAKAEGALADLAKTSGQIDAGAIAEAFDHDQILDAFVAVRSIDDAVRDLVKTVDEDFKGKIPDIFDPDDVNASAFLDKISSLREPIQARVQGALAAGDPAGAVKIAAAYVDQITAAMDGKLTRDQVVTLLGLGNLFVEIDVALKKDAVAKAKRELEILTGLGGEDAFTASIALALDAGTITGEQAQTLIQAKLAEAGVEIPAALAVPTTDTAVAAAEAALTGKAVKIPAEIEPLDRVTSRIDPGSVKVPPVKVGADTAEAEGAVDDLAALVEDADPVLTPKADTKRADSDLDAVADQKRTALIVADALTAQAENELNALTRSRTVIIRERLVTSGAPAPGTEATSSPRAVRASSPITNVTVMLPPGSDSDSRVVASIQRWARRNGRVPV